MAENEEAGDKGFLQRWSKRKRAAREAEAPPEPQPPAELTVDAAEPEPEIDPATLPPIESITTGADLQAFLQKGVPKALKQAALRRLWSADAKIRDFREVADYDWDFNAPGYGALLPKDDPGAVADKLLAAIRRRVPAPPQEVLADQPDTAEAKAVDRAEPATPAEPEPEPPCPAEAPATTAATSPEPPPEPPIPRRRRRHGAATPS